jgi:molybdopterin converting factor subunit 1
LSLLVRLYAGVREASGRAELRIEAPRTVGELRDALARAHPAIAGRLAYCRFAVADEFVPDDAPLADGATVDVIPPVSGG